MSKIELICAAHRMPVRRLATLVKRGHEIHITQAEAWYDAAKLPLLAGCIADACGVESVAARVYGLTAFWAVPARS